MFFLGDRLTGLIDFYFACNDSFAYDLGVCLNAWCFEPDGQFNVSKGMAMIRGYEKRRPLTAAEVEALPILARGSALRFMLTRLVDWLNVPPGAKVTPKNPLEYLTKMRFHQRVVSARDYGRLRVSDRVVVFTDGACSGNPGPGGWGAILRLGRAREDAVGRRAADHQQPHGAHRRRSWRSRRSPARARVELHTDSHYLRDGVTQWIHGWKRNGWRTADKKPVKNEDLWRRLDEAASRHEVDWRWVRGHAGHALNERADELAREGMAPFLPGKKKAEG